MKKPLLNDGSEPPTTEDLGFQFDIDDPLFDIDDIHEQLASDFALWFSGHVYKWHPEEIARAAIRYAIASGDVCTKDQVEQMLSDAMGVPKKNVWAELGTKRGFGKRIA